MKTTPLIHRYLFTELVPPFAINLAFFTFIFLTSRILDITNLVVNHGVGLLQVLLVIVYTIPYFMVFVIPMAVMMAVLLTFLRLSGDNEIMALKAGGVNVTALLPPVVVFCLLGGLLTAFMSIYGQPWGRSSAKQLVVRIAASSIDIGLKERQFNDTFDGIVLYVSQVDTQTRTLRDVFIENQQDDKLASTVVAPRGQLLRAADGLTWRLRLFDGTIHQVDLQEFRANAIRFDTYDLTLSLAQMLEPQKRPSKHRREMNLAELRQYIREHQAARDAGYFNALMRYHKMFSIPFACLVLGFLAMPLGMQAKRVSKSYGLGLGLVFFMLYYLLLSAGSVFGESGRLPPIAAVWMPNLVMAAVGVFLFVRMAQERPLRFDLPADLLERWSAAWRRLRRRDGH
ncbi:MAG: LPS export ABC transporter permease LptF [Desulfobacterales bacterium]|nr:LPS export ABC transporter permease LptF [Desulfobacterales bacterium]